MRLMDARTMAARAGLDAVAVTSAEPLAEVEAFLRHRARTGMVCRFETGDPGQRIRPSSVLPGARSVIVAALSYHVPAAAFPASGRGDGLVARVGATDREEDAFRGLLARVAWGRDYHRVMRERLERLVSLIRGAHGGSFLALVDGHPLTERALAARAGLGWIGKNCCLIAPPFGSWVVLGLVLTDLELAAGGGERPGAGARVRTTGCGGCRRCLDACPTGALRRPYELDPARCLSYLTQKSGYLPRRWRRVLGNRLYGCDRCQEVCPFNAGPQAGCAREEFTPASEDVAYPPLAVVVGASNRVFRAWLGLSAADWVGRTVIQRNAVVALGNARHPAAVPFLLRCLDDPRPVIRGHAAWALQGSGVEAVRALKVRGEAESDPAAAAEVRAALVAGTGCRRWVEQDPSSQRFQRGGTLCESLTSASTRMGEDDVFPTGGPRS